jgi:hypothetical protein
MAQKALIRSCGMGRRATANAFTRTVILAQSDCAGRGGVPASETKPYTDGYSLQSTVNFESRCALRAKGIPMSVETTMMPSAEPNPMTRAAWNLR